MDATLALGFPKAGLLAFPGAARVGQLATLDIGLPDAVGQENIPLELLTPAWVGSRLPPRPLDSHKGTYGHLLVVAGSRHYVGAACLVARAAHRAGAGLVTLATPQSVYPIAAAQLTETIHLPLPEDAHGRIHPDAAAIIRDVLPRYDALALGSGLGLSDSTVNFIEKLLLDNPSPNLPVLVDADGLNCLARSSNWWQRCSGPLVLTPHPGEMSTLTGQPVAAIQQDRVAAARHWAAIWQAIVVLKGAFTAIAQPGPKLDPEPGVVPGTVTRHRTRRKTRCTTRNPARRQCCRRTGPTRRPRPPLPLRQPRPGRRRLRRRPHRHHRQPPRPGPVLPSTLPPAASISTPKPPKP